MGASGVTFETATGRGGAPPPCRRRPRSLRRRWLVAAATSMLLLAACGGDEEAGEDDPEAEGAEAGAEEAGEAAEEAAAEAETNGEDADDNEGGVREHRPPDDADTFADCGSIGEDDPGAVIRFPSEDVSGSLDAGSGPVMVEVVGCGNTFEANVQWEAYHGDDRSPTLEGHTTGGTMGDWDVFTIVETYWTPGDWTVVVFEIDAESGERQEYDQVTFSVG